jgi:hypothetical protein
MRKLRSRYNYIYRLKARSISGFNEGEGRHQATLIPERLDDRIGAIAPPFIKGRVSYPGSRKLTLQAADLFS